jgi:elongation factor P
LELGKSGTIIWSSVKRERILAVAISTADFKNGMCIEFKDKLFTIVEFQHVKPGKGPAFVRTKLRDIRTGRVIENTFNAGVKMEAVRLETKTMQYLYNDGADFYFMDTTDFEQISLSAETVGDKAQWLKENDEVSLLYAGDELIGLEPQMFVELKIVDTEPGFKGDTVQGGGKPATLETGAVVNVPMYMEVGETVQVDTRDGRFVKRV